MPMENTEQKVTMPAQEKSLSEEFKVWHGTNRGSSQKILIKYDS